MSFFTLQFAGFLTVLFLLWWSLPVKTRPVVLSLANLVFAFSLGSQVLWALVIITFLGYLFGLLAAKAKHPALLWVGIGTLILPLALYKYLPVMASHFAWAAPFGSLAAPLGISFYSFKSISYLIQVKKGQQRPVTDFAEYFSFVGFFPQLPMGPIQRADSFFGQLTAVPRQLNPSLAYNACTRICWALFLKKCLADSLAGYLDALVNPIQYYSLSMVWSLGAYCLYLYFDFAAFSQMAIGFGELLGLGCEENFKSPYFSRSVGEFWHRWHISLSSFLRDYVYIPLGGSRNGAAKLVVATMVTFLLSGVWHGATSGFLVWGALHGLWLLCGRATKAWRERFWAKLPKFFSGPLRSVLAWGFTLTLIFSGWLLFYAGSLSHALELAGQMLSPIPFSLQYVKESLVQLNLVPENLFLLGGMVLIAALVDFASRRDGFGAWAQKLRPWMRVIFCYFCIFSVMFFGVGGSLPGVYFEF